MVTEQPSIPTSSTGLRPKRSERAPANGMVNIDSPMVVALMISMVVRSIPTCSLVA